MKNIILNKKDCFSTINGKIVYLDYQRQFLAGYASDIDAQLTPEAMAWCCHRIDDEGNENFDWKLEEKSDWFNMGVEWYQKINGK